MGFRGYIFLVLNKKVAINCQNSSLRDFGGAARYVQKLIEHSKLDQQKEYDFSYVNYKEFDSWDDQLSLFQKKLKIWSNKVPFLGGLVEYVYGFLLFHLFFLSSRIKLTKILISSFFKTKKSTSIKPIVYNSEKTLSIYHEPINYVSAHDIGQKLAKRNFAFCSTFLDIQDLYFPENFNSKTLSERLLNYSLYKDQCDFFFAISEFTKKTMVEKLNINPDKIFVTYLGADLIQSKQKPLDHQYHEKFGRYWIYPAKFWPHKNHKFLLKGISALAEKFRNENVKIILTGGFDVRDHEQLKILCEELKVSDLIIVLGFVTDFQMNSLIIGAEFMVFPSLFEGFGMPILEAMNLGCPVVCAKSSSLAEVGQGAAHFFDPLILDSWISVAELMLNGRLDRVKMIENAKSISAKFTWGNTYLETLKAYRRFS